MRRMCSGPSRFRQLERRHADCFNVRYLLDGLKAMGSDRLPALQCTHDAGRLRSDEASEAFTYLVMPVQIRS